jgi:hypothetical protein
VQRGQLGILAGIQFRKPGIDLIVLLVEACGLVMFPVSRQFAAQIFTIPAPDQGSVRNLAQ